MKDEHNQSMTKMIELFDKLSEKQKSQEKQMSGWRSFARHVEQFLDQPANRGATAPSDPQHPPRLENESMLQRNVPGASSSSARPPADLQPPKPPSVPAPPVPCGSATPPESNRAGTTHFSTVRSEVRSGAIRIEITNPEQWSAEDTAILRNQKAGSKEGARYWQFDL